MSDFIPNSFQVPNVVIDEYLCKLSANAFKAYMFIVRKTKGWNKSSDGISQSQFMEALGVGSDNTVRKALDELLKFNLILEKKTQGRYSVFFIDVPAQNDVFTSAESADVPPQKVRNTSAESADVPPQKVRTQTNTNQTNTNKVKKSKQKKAAGVALDLSNLPISESLASELVEYRKTVKKNPLTQRALLSVAKKMDEVSCAFGISHDEVMTLIQEKGWASIELAWVKNLKQVNGYGNGNQSGGYAGETEAQRIRRINAESREHNLKHGTKSTDDHF